MNMLDTVCARFGGTLILCHMCQHCDSLLMIVLFLTITRSE